MIVPLKILITDSSLLADEGVKEQIDKLEKAGHSIVIDDSMKAYDFITGPNCWLLRAEVANLFTMAVANARKIVASDEGRQLAHKEWLVKNKSTKAGKAPAKRASKVSKRSTKVEADLGDVIPGSPIVDSSIQVGPGNAAGTY